jgi:hypothetical protein
MFCAATRPHLLSTHLSAPIAPRWSRPSGCKNAHRGPSGLCRSASAPTRSQLLIASGKNTRCRTIAPRTPLLPQGNLDQLATVTVAANRMVPCDQLQGANNTIQPLLDAANKAYSQYPLRPIDMVWPMSALRGTRIHSFFASEVTGLGPPYSAEVSYLGGVPVPYGTPGSVRADAIVGPINAPLYAVELKSGAALPTASETAAYNANLPPGTGTCSIVEAPGP